MGFSFVIFFLRSLSTTKPPPGTAALCSSAGIADAVWPGSKPRSCPQNINLNFCGHFMGFFWVCLTSVNGEQVSRQAWQSLIPWLVLFVFALLGWISCQKKKKLNNVDFFLYLSAFPGFKAMNRGSFTRASICEIGYFCLPCTWLKADAVWALWAPENLSCCGLDQTSQVPTWDPVNFVSRLPQSYSASTVRCSNLTVL